MNDETTNTPLDDSQYDAVFLHSRRESVILLLAFAFFLVWSVGTSYFMGYEMSPEETGQLVLGVPRWIFWGVAVPWLGANVFTFVFCSFFMADDPLGEALDEQDVASIQESEERT